MFASMGRFMILIGAILLGLGVFFVVLGRFLPLGKLPGDIFIQKENITIYFPVVTMIIISLLLTIIFNFLNR